MDSDELLAIRLENMTLNKRINALEEELKDIRFFILKLTAPKKSFLEKLLDNA